MIENICSANTRNLSYQEREEIQQKLYERDLKKDMKEGLEILFSFSEKINTLHPTAKAAIITLIRLHH